MEALLKKFKYLLQRKLFKLKRHFRQGEKNFYSLDSFKQRLAIEKRRSERLNYKSSIIFFSVKNIIHNKGRLKKLPIERIARIICSNIRSTDVVALYKKQTILILLPDTDNNGAQCACERLVNKIMASFSSDKKLTHDNFHIKILSFPERRIPETAVDDFFNDTRRFERITNSQSLNVQNVLSFKNDYVENLNLCLSSFNGSTISMPIVDLFFWDQQLMSRYLLFGKKIIKRIMDIIGSIVGIALSLFIMLIAALIVKITSPGPIFFKQRRVGYKGNYFTFLKFRSMFIDNEDSVHQDYVKKLIHGEKDQINNGTNEKPFFKIKDDPRITPFGKFLRKTSLDELPQFINVLKGEMSLVGPRPPIPYEVKEYQDWHFRRILEVKPGITGLWQVSGRSRTTFDEMVRLDIEYAKNWSLLMDIKILFKTVTAVFSADGT